MMKPGKQAFFSADFKMLRAALERAFQITAPITSTLKTSPLGASMGSVCLFSA